VEKASNGVRFAGKPGLMKELRAIKFCSVEFFFIEPFVRYKY
jgi:hypothetical protein